MYIHSYVYVCTYVGPVYMDEYYTYMYVRMYGCMYVYIHVCIYTS